MSLILDNTLIPGFDIKVSATLTLAGEDLSGQSSYTPQAETGDKPKAMSVTTNIKFDNPADLTRLVNMAEAKNDNDSRQVYNIINTTAKAMNIRQVTFQGDLQVKEQDSLRAWSVSFKLIEFDSIPEKKEQRATTAAVKEQAAAGVPIVPIESPLADQTAAQLSWLQENVINKVNETLL